MSGLDTIALRTITGGDARLADHAGQVRLIVNVASKCGLTPQYAGLEALYERYRDRGFTILGFPANDFGAQEPGTDDEILQFCMSNFGVAFPMFSKIAVNGGDRHPLYQALIAAGVPAQSSDAGFADKLARYGFRRENPDDILWNFEKFLIDREGKVAARFTPEVQADDPLLVNAIEAELAR